MKKKTSRLLFGFILLISMVLGTYAIMAKGYATSPPLVWTDKPDYGAGETVSISGSGFNPTAYFDIPVIRPDGTIVKGDGTFAPGWDAIQADGNGNLIYYYTLDGVNGIYEVRVYNSPWSGSISETPLASTTFSDANPAANLDQARNGAFDSPVSPVDWQNGNLGGQQAHFIEGYSVPYRCVMTSMPTGESVTLVLAYKVKDSNNNALDYLTSYNRINNPLHQDVFGHSPETINPLQNGTGTSLTAADASHISGTVTTFLIPTPPTLNTPVPGQPTGSYNNVISNEGIAAEEMTLYGGTLDNITYDAAADLSLANVYQFINVTFHLDGTTAVLAWGGHIASREDWGFFPDGEPRSAGGIHGSPYHMAIEGWSSPDPTTNKALGNLGAQDRSLSAVAVFAPPVPFIALSKTPSATKVLNTTLVTYTYNVTNTGGVDFTNVTIIDDTFGTITTGQTLNVNQSKTFIHTTTLNHTTTNIATAFGTTGANATVNATATATVTVIHPSLSLTKTPNANKVENSTLVTYTYNITNTGDTSLTVSLVDDTFGTIFTGKVLAPGAFNVTVIKRTLTTTTTNTATATGIDQLGTNVTARASATVTVLHPSIALTKEPSSTKVENGTLVVYAYNVTNTGDVSLSGNITDNIFGLIGSFALSPGTSIKFTKNVALTATTTNAATAIGVDQLGTSVSAQDSATVTVIHPAITLSKSVSSSKVENGSSVTYTYNVTNTGDTSLSGNLTDDTFGFIGSFVLSPGSFETFSKTAILTLTTTNTATAVGADQLGTSVTDQASATVTVLHPSISLTKTPSASKVENGSSVTYTYNITNTGDTSLSGNVTDDVFGLIGSFALSPDSSMTLTKTVILTTTTANTATVVGVDQLGTSVTDQASATVTVLHPNIDLTKTPSSTKVENGTTVTYVYNVTNTGDVALSGNVTDDVFGPVGTFTNLLPGDSIAFSMPHALTANTTNKATAIGIDQLGTDVTAEDSATVTVLHPQIHLTKTPSSSKVENGSSVTYTYNVTNTGDTSLSGNLTDDTFGFIGSFVLSPGSFETFSKTAILTLTTTNTATAVGVDQLGTSAADEASATVIVLHPSIDLTKTPSSAKVENGTIVYYTYNVTNTGDVALSGNVTDDIFGLIGAFINLPSGDWTAFAIPHVLTANTTNTATAIGVDQLGTSVTDQASATVTVLHPSIKLTKTPSSTKVENGSSVTYTYNITNTGDTSLSGNLTDDTFGFIGSFVLFPASSMTFDKTVTLMSNTTNTATAIGVDQLGTAVTAQANAFVHVIHPSVSLTKTPSSSKVVTGSNVTYTYNVTNTGDTALGGNVTDDLLGLVGTFSLSPGMSAIFTKTTALTANTTNIATATGVDQLGTEVKNTSSGFVFVIHPSIEVTKSCSPEDQLAPGTITWTVNVTNTGDVTLNAINVTDTRHGVLGAGVTLASGQTITFTIVETGLAPGTYYDNATAFGAYQLGVVSDWGDASCTVRPVFVLKQFTNVTVLPIGKSEGFNATLVNSTLVNVLGLNSGPKIYFTVTYYFENSLNFLGSNFDGQAHNFTLWDKWGGNLMALGSPPVAFNQKTNIVTLADGSIFKIDPTLSGPGTYRGYIGSGLNISNLASQGQAWITMHLGDQQNSTNPGKGNGSGKDGNSYDTDTVWYIGELGVNQSATLTLYIAPGKNPGGKLQFTSPGCTVINTGPRVRAYGNTYADKDFLFAVERTNTLTVCVSPKP